METIKKMFSQTFYIFKKNFILETKNILGCITQFIMPCLVCCAIILSNKFSEDFTLTILLPLYIGNLNISIIRKFTIYFIRERQLNYKKYQLIAGLNPVSFLTGNLFYMYAFTSIVLSPVFFVLISYQFKKIFIIYFAVFVMTSSNVILVLTLLFKDPRLASQIIGIIFSLSIFAYYIVDLKQNHLYTYLLLCFPANSFALSIIQDSLIPSSIVLLFSKLVMPIYSYFQLNIHPLKKCRDCAEKCRKKQAEIQTQQNMQQKSIIVMENVCKVVDKLDILKNITMNVKKGEVIGILGGNGSGKTSLIELITDQYSQYEGTIEIAEDVSIGVCYQQQMLYEEMSVKEIINFYIQLKGAKKQELQLVLNQVDLLNQKNKLIKYLSNGEKRKLSIGISLLGQSNLLIFDEPTVGLDVFSRKHIWNIFQNLKDNGKTLILVTNDIEEIYDLGDKLYILQNGIIINSGSPQEIRNLNKKRTLYLKIEGLVNTPQIIKIEMERSLIQTTFSETHKIYEINSDQINSENLIIILQLLEVIPNISVSIQYPSHEQLYLQLLNSQNIHNNHDQISPRPPVGQKKQFLAMILRKLYHLNRNSISIFMYFSNILMLIIGFLLYHNNIMQPQIKEWLILHGFYFLMGEILWLIVQEKQRKILDIMKMKGLKWWNYWLSNFLFDYTIILINLGAIEFLLQNLINFFELMLFGAAILTFIYACSYLYSNSTNACVYFTVLNFYIGFSIPLLNLIKIPFIKKIILMILEWCYPLYFLQNPEMIIFKTTQIYLNIFQIFFYLGIMFIHENSYLKKFRFAKNSNFIKENVKLQNVSVTHGSQQKQSLKSINLVVQNSETLALLGPNGAGKSTIFKLLTHQVQQKNGDVYCQNRLCEPFISNFESKNICYQQEAFWQNLTPRQTIKIYSFLTGVTNIQNQIVWLAKNLDLKCFDMQLQKFNKNYKKKYSFAFTLIGNSSVKLFDESTTGLDAFSTKKIFNLLKKKQDMQTIIYSTHCLNEVQLICDKVAILIKGQLVEHKTLKELKEDYFPSCYIMNIQLKVDFKQIQTIITKELHEYKIEIIEQSKKRIKGKVLKVNNSSDGLSILYKKLVHMQSKGIIYQFNIGEPRLQDIYLQIVKNYGTQF